MRIIAISGKSGSGKTTLAKFLQENLENSVHINYDVLNRNLMQNKEHIDYAITLFSENILNEDGSLDRKKIADIIYCNNDLYYAWVGHMLMACDNEVNKIVKNTNYDWLIIEHANIMYSRFSKVADFTILAKACFKTRLQRLAKRDGLLLKDLKSRDRNVHLVNRYNAIYNGKNQLNILAQIKKELC